MTKESAAKTAGRALVPQRHGGALLTSGMPGNAGGGRPPDAFRAMCRELASSDAVLARVAEILADPNHPMFLGALKWATEHGYGKPRQEVDVSVEERRGVILIPAASWGREPGEITVVDGRVEMKRLE